jgi:hypothetical protein
MLDYLSNCGDGGRAPPFSKTGEPRPRHYVANVCKLNRDAIEKMPVVGKIAAVSGGFFGTSRWQL